MNKQPLLWMAAVTLGTVLYGVDTIAAAPGINPGPTPTLGVCTPPVRAVNAPPWPSLAQCGSPDFNNACPALRPTCAKINQDEATKISAASNNKLFGTKGDNGKITPGFTPTAKQRNYGIATSAPATFANNGVVPNLAAQRAALHQPPKSYPPSIGKVARRGPNTNGRWAQQESQARVDALAWTPQGLLATYQRPHAAAGGNGVASCEDYVYKGFYDDERWLDAMYGCKGDARCEANISLLGQTPGIAGRALNNPLSPSFTQFTPDYDGRMDLSGLIPKNAFFAGTGAFIPSSLIEAFASDPKKKAMVQALADLLHSGFTSYDIGHGKHALNGMSEGFTDEWDFHRTLNGLTAAVTEGEFDEYKRRDDKVLAAMDNFWTVAKCSAHLNPDDCRGVPNAVGHVMPGDTQMFDGDPFASRAVFGNINQAIATDMLSFVTSKAGMMDALHAGANIGRGLAFPGLANRGAVTLGSPLLQTGFAPTQKAMMATIGPKPGVAPNLVTHQGVRIKGQQSPGVSNGGLAYLDLNWRPNGSTTKPTYAPVIDTSSPYPRLLCPTVGNGKPSTPATSWARYDQVPKSENFVGELAACQAVNVILEEWGRKLAGDQGPTCFDGGNRACDWSPDMFVKRWVVNALGYGMEAKERAYSACKAWKSNIFSPPYPATQSSPQAAMVAISDSEIRRAKILRGIPVKGSDNFGQDKADQQTGGNKAFGVGYSYDLGWEAKIFQRDAQKAPCRMGGRVHASFEADAWAFGLPPIAIVEANFALDANDDKNQVENGLIQAYGHGDFLSGAYEFYKIPDGTKWDLNGASAQKTLAGAHDGGEQTIVTIPVQISWVTLTFTIGLAWGYGADVIVTAAAPSKDQCTPKSLLEIGGAVVPFAHLDLVVGADCSIAGIAGVGVDVDVELLGIKLPLHGGAHLSSSADSKLWLNFDAGLTMHLETLGGHMSAYAKFLGIKLFEVELFHWKGLQTDVPIFHVESPPFLLADLGSATIESKPTGGAMICKKPGETDQTVVNSTAPACPVVP
jgi:hypothetical protein